VGCAQSSLIGMFFGKYPPLADKGHYRSVIQLPHSHRHSRGLAFNTPIRYEGSRSLGTVAASALTGRAEPQHFADTVFQNQFRIAEDDGSASTGPIKVMECLAFSSITTTCVIW
jgi:hypothetical protein